MSAAADTLVGWGLQKPSLLEKVSLMCIYVLGVFALDAGPPLLFGLVRSGHHFELSGPGSAVCFG